MAASRLRIGIRIGGFSSPRHAFLAGSLAVHAVLVLAVLLLPELFRRPRLNADYMPVELVGSLPAAKAAPAPPAAKPATPPPPRPQPEEDVQARPAEPKVVKKPKPRPTPPPAEPAAETPPAAPAVPAGTAGSAEAGGTIAPMEGGDVEFAWYRSSVTAALYSHWQRPILTSIAEPLEVRIEFEILRDGTVRGVRVSERSGVPSMDRSALRAVSDASPLPPLPSKWREPSLPAAFVFRLYPGDF